MAWRRLHQPQFRVRVLRAYEGTCTICRLCHRQLLDAAHIIGDSHDRGDGSAGWAQPLHDRHAAYYRNLLGVTGDGEIRVNRRLLDEIDGPMLQNRLKEIHGTAIIPPEGRTDRPDRERLDERYQRFVSAARKGSGARPS